jgi:nucleoside-diphosphate-sugar epimerase
MSHRILVTGGAGYIGSILVPELLAQGHEVTVLDNFMYHQSSLAHVCINPGFRMIRGDVRVESTLLPLLKEADVIIPLAALVGAPLCNQDPVGAESTNLEAPLRLFHLASRDQIILMPTTNSAYGTGNQDNQCDETSPLNPISLYAKHKLKVEEALMGMENVISFRLATVFGMSPRLRLDLLVNDFTYRAVNDRFIILFEAHFKRNYIHVRDVANVFLWGMEHIQSMKGQIYNVGLSEANLSKLELCQAIQRHVPAFTVQEASIGKDPDQRNYIVSNAKIEATGWRPKYSLDQGIQELIKGFAMIRNSVYGNA